MNLTKIFRNTPYVETRTNKCIDKGFSFIKYKSYNIKYKSHKYKIYVGKFFIVVG